MLFIDTRKFRRFWPVSWAINHHFRVPEQFPRLTNPRVHLSVGLLITVLGSQSNFHHSQTLGCIYVFFIGTRKFGRFLPVSWASNHRFWVPKRFPRLRNPGCIYVLGINTRSFSRS